MSGIKQPRYEYSAKSITDDFRYARKLMREVERMMRDDTISDYSNDTDFGQTINELVGSVSNVYNYQHERLKSDQLY